MYTKERGKKVNKKSFLNTNVLNVSQVYKGKRDCCRCGCGGIYTSTSYMLKPRSDINDKKVSRYLEQAKKLIKQGVDVIYGDTYVDVETGDNKTLTFYFDEVKK